MYLIYLDLFCLTWTFKLVSLGGCVYLLQLWMWHRIPVGRPIVRTPHPWFPGVPSRRRPTVAHIWDQVDVPYARAERAYIEYTNELDTLAASQVTNICWSWQYTYSRHHYCLLILFFTLQFIWQPYEEVTFALSDLCGLDEDLYRMKCPLICFYAVEWHLPYRVSRQFGKRQAWPVPPHSTSYELHQ